MTHRLLLRCFRVFTLLLSLFSLPAAAVENAAPGARLIATSPTQRVWMTPTQVESLARWNHVQGHCGGFMDVTDEDATLVKARPMAFVDRPLSRQTAVGQLLPQLSAGRIVDTITQLQNYQNRYYQSATGVEAAHRIKGMFLDMAAGRRDVTVKLFKHNFSQPSVIARIAGHGPHADEVVVLGAHEDSINWSGSRPTVHDRAPGADDNASGVAVLLETFRVLMAGDVQPDRTIEFMAYAGEELGLLGSQDIAQAYRKGGTQVAAVLQMDMTMFPANTRKITLINDNVSRPLNAFTARLVDAYLSIPWQAASCGYACSDHASWTKVGYPAVFPFEADLENMNPNVHTARDTLDHGLDQNFGLEFAKLTTAFAVELAL